VAAEEDIGDAPVGATLLGESVVLFRSEGTILPFDMADTSALQNVSNVAAASDDAEKILGGNAVEYFGLST
jgi:hypothetical protein